MSMVAAAICGIGLLFLLMRSWMPEGEVWGEDVLFLTGFVIAGSAYLAFLWKFFWFAPPRSSDSQSDPWLGHISRARRLELMVLDRKRQKENGENLDLHRQVCDWVIRHRLTTPPRWYRLHWPEGCQQLDLVGRSAHGRRRMLARLGREFLDSGQRILIVDATRGDVARDLLAETAERPGAAVRMTSPAQLHRIGLLNGITPREFAAIVDEAVSDGFDGGAKTLGSLYETPVRVVADALRGNLTFERLAAGIRVIKGEDPDRIGRPGLLTRTELTDLRRGRQHGAAIGPLDVLENIFGGFAEDEAGANARVTAGLSGRITVITSDAVTDRYRDFADCLLVSLLRRRLSGSTGQVPALIVLAGAPKLPARLRDGFTGEARRRGLKVLQLLDRLTEDGTPLTNPEGRTGFLGPQGGEAAQEAAQHIGYVYRDVLSQQSAQINVAHNFHIQRVAGEKEVHSDGRSVIKGQGVSYNREYGLVAEPEELRGLADTAFLLVLHPDDRPAGLGPRVVRGDCAPKATPETISDLSYDDHLDREEQERAVLHDWFQRRHIVAAHRHGLPVPPTREPGTELFPADQNRPPAPPPARQNQPPAAPPER